jgi:predicted phosphodiesterase
MADPGACALPAFAAFSAPATWRAIDFLSDLHLSESTPRTFDALATHLRCTEADAVFILGDLFEVWIGDDARHEGFEARCAAMLSEASSHRFIAFMAGNRDFLVGADMLAHCGVMHLTDPTVLSAFDQRLLLSHGDTLCLSDVAYQRFRARCAAMPGSNVSCRKPSGPAVAWPPTCAPKANGRNGGRNRASGSTSTPTAPADGWKPPARPCSCTGTRINPPRTRWATASCARVERLGP